MNLKRKNLVVKVLVIVEPDDGGFHAFCPALKGLHTCGDTQDEAIENAQDAVIAYIRSIIKHGDPLPIGCDYSPDTRVLPISPPAYQTEQLLSITV
jgi:predicted RNase H-like HicB family nuclease